MKPFLLFAYNTYYPQGGYHDLVGDFATVEEAVAKGREGMDAKDTHFSGVYDSYHVIHEGKVVEFGGRDDPPGLEEEEHPLSAESFQVQTELSGFGDVNVTVVNNARGLWFKVTDLDGNKVSLSPFGREQITAAVKKEALARSIK